MTWTAVVPTVGRPQLGRMLGSLARACGSGLVGGPEAVVVVDDRREPRAPLDRGGTALPVRVVRTGGRGPAAARNAGWRLARTPWVVFLDDDVVLPPDWGAGLDADRAAAGLHVCAVYGRLRVPRGERPTDWERNTAGLERARYATADAAVRRTALEEVDGFDERFPRAYREDADVALRLRRAGWELADGRRVTIHPVRPAAGSVSVRVQAGARDDARMRALHGRTWRARAETGRGRFPLHVATVAAGAVALGAVVARGTRPLAAASAAGWAALGTDFMVRRIAPGPSPGRRRPPPRRRSGRTPRPPALAAAAPGGPLRPRRHARPRRALQR